MNWAKSQAKHTQSRITYHTHIDVRTTEEGASKCCRSRDDTQIIENIDFLWREERGLNELKRIGPLVLKRISSGRMRNGGDL